MTTSKIPVIFDHDGGIDDLISLMLLLTMERIDLLGITITPADCFIEEATETTLKILSLFQRSDIPVARGDQYGVNPFHYDWRAQPKILNALPALLSIPLDTRPLVEQPARSFIATMLANRQQPVTILMTGPCSNLMAAIDADAAIKGKIAAVIWMGGAVDVAGNVAIHNHDNSAEWNVYWDPYAAKALFESGLPIKLIPLNATNCLPIDKQFLSRVAAQRQFSLSELAGQFWAATVTAIPTYEFTYHLWDVLATSALELDRDAIHYQMMELEVCTNQPQQGRTQVRPGNNQWIEVAIAADHTKVTQYLLNKLRQNFPIAT